jgi:hypothetical protein
MSACRLPICQPANLPTCQPANLPTCQPANLPTCQPVNLSTCQPAHLPASSPATLPFCPPIYHPSRMPQCLTVRPSTADHKCKCHVFLAICSLPVCLPTLHSDHLFVSSPFTRPICPSVSLSIYSRP